METQDAPRARTSSTPTLSWSWPGKTRHRCTQAPRSTSRAAPAAGPITTVCWKRPAGSPTSSPSKPLSLHLFAGLRVRDFQAARPWYERLLGEPTFFPHATEAVWTLAEDRSVSVVEHADGAGSSVVTIFIDDLDAQVAAIAARGLEPDERETYSTAYVRRSTATLTATSWGSAARRSTAVHRPDGGRRRDAGAMALCLTT